MKSNSRITLSVCTYERQIHDMFWFSDTISEEVDDENCIATFGNGVKSVNKGAIGRLVDAFLYKCGKMGRNPKSERSRPAIYISEPAWKERPSYAWNDEGYWFDYIRDSSRKDMKMMMMLDQRDFDLSFRPVRDDVAVAYLDLDNGNMMKGWPDSVEVYTKAPKSREEVPEEDRNYRVGGK